MEIRPKKIETNFTPIVEELHSQDYGLDIDGEPAPNSTVIDTQVLWSDVVDDGNKPANNATVGSSLGDAAIYIYAKTANYTVVKEDCYGDRMITNDGASAVIEFTLPGPEPGYKIIFTCMETYDLVIKCLVGNSFYDGDTIQGHSWISLNEIGSSAIIYAPNSSEWVIANAGGAALYAGEKGYIFAGYKSGANTQDVNEYNSVTDANSGKTSIPAPSRRGNANCSIDDNGYSASGFDAAGIKDTDEYNVSGDSWTSKTDCPNPARYDSEFEAIDNNDGYLVGGNDGGSLLQDNDEYDPDTWTAKTAMPVPARAFFGASNYNSKIYCYGGTTATKGQDCDEYDPDTWTGLTSMPAPARDEFDGCTIGTKIYAMGGYNTTPTEINDNDEYDPYYDTWASKTNIPSPSRRQAGTTDLINKGYMFSGYSGAAAILDIDEYDVNSDSYTSKSDYSAGWYVHDMTTITQ
jgi:hypothetical protein